MAIVLVPRRLPPVCRPAGQLGYFYNLHCLCPDQLGTTRPCGAHVARAACTAFGGRQAQRVWSCSVEVMLRYHNSVCKKAELIIPHHELTQTSDRMVTVASEGPVCVGWRHWWAATLSNGPGEAGDSRGATWAMLRSRRPGGWTAGRRGEAGGGRGQPCARRGCEGSAATACAAAGELLRRLWLGQRHPYDWGHRWERRRRVLGGDWGVGAPRERPSEVPRCRGHDGVVETAAGAFLHAARAVSERQSGPSMGAERWGTLEGQQALCVGGWGGWRCAHARRPRRPDAVLDGDGSPRGGAAAATCHGESNPDPWWLMCHQEGPASSSWTVVVAQTGLLGNDALVAMMPRKSGQLDLRARGTR